MSTFLLHQHFLGDEIMSLYCTGMVTLLVFKKYKPANLKLVKVDDSDDMDEYIRKVDKQIMKETKETKRDFKYYSKHINREMVFESESVVPQCIAIHHGV